MITYKQQPSKDDQKKREAEYKESFAGLFKSLGLKDPYFKTKIPQRVKGSDTLEIGLFPSEFQKMVEFNSDSFYMLIDWGWDPYNGDKTLYRLRKNEFYEQEFEFDGIKFKVPIDELEPVTLVEPVVSLAAIQSMRTTTLDDNNFQSLTVRDIASILLKTPQSNKPWLNELIRKA